MDTTTNQNKRLQTKNNKQRLMQQEKEEFKTEELNLSQFKEKLYQCLLKTNKGGREVYGK